MASGSKSIALIVYADTEAPTNLAKEARDAQSILRGIRDCDTKLVPAPGVEELIAELQLADYRDRVEIFYYAGHANGSDALPQLQEEGGLTLIIDLLKKQQRNLGLIFLNNAADQAQIDELLGSGIDAAIVATEAGIDDQVAMKFALALYKALTEDRDVQSAFVAAENAYKADCGDDVSKAYAAGEGAPLAPGRLPWKIYGTEKAKLWKPGQEAGSGRPDLPNPDAFPLKTSSPYLGLRRFEETDKGRFFGRDSFVEGLVQAGEKSPLLVVLGPSGSGKSSVVRAGWIPKWKDAPERGPAAKSFVFTPDANPFESFYIALCVAGYSQTDARFVREPSPEVLTKAAEQLRGGDPWFILIDQFEEVFTRIADKEEALRDDFIAALVNFHKAAIDGVQVVLAMRDDFFPNLGAYSELATISDNNMRRLTALDRYALREVIERPAAEHGVRFEANLPQIIIEEVKGRPGMLPLLQYTLNALWEKDDVTDRVLNIATYQNLGGVTGALEQRFDHFYEEECKSESEKRALRRVLLRLVETAVGNKAASRRAKESEFADEEDKSLLQRLVEEKLLVTSQGGDGDESPAVELAHEALIDSWPQFQDWVEEGRETLIVRNRLTHDADDWESAKAQGEAAANDELLRGNQLAGVLEIEGRGDFDERLGGLSEREKAFLKASKSARAKERKIKLRRKQKWVAAYFTMAGLIVVAVGIGIRSYETGKQKEILEVEKEKVEELNKKLGVQNEKVEGLNEELGRSIESKLWSDNANKQLSKPVPDRFGAAMLMARAVYFDGGYASEEQRKENGWDFSSPFDLSQSREALGEKNILPVWQSPIERHHDGQVNAVAVSPDGGTLASAGESGAVKLWNLDNGQLLYTFRGHEGAVTSLAMNSSGSTLVSGGEDTTVRLWDMNTGNAIGVPLAGHGNPISEVAFSHGNDRDVLASGDEAGEIKLWRVKSGSELKTIDKKDGHPRGVTGLTFSPDGSTLASGGTRGNVFLWDVKKLLGKGSLSDFKQRTWKREQSLTCLAIAKRGDRVLLATGSRQGNIKVWDADSESSSEELLLDIPGDQETQNLGITSLVFSQDGGLLASSGEDGLVKLWNSETGNPDRTLSEHRGTVSDLDFIGTESLFLASVGVDGTVKRWDVTSGEEYDRENKLRGQQSPKGIVAVSPDGRGYAAGARSGKIDVWKFDGGKFIRRRLDGHPGGVTSITFNRDGTLLGSGGKDGFVRIWNGENGAVNDSVEAHQGDVTGLAFTPDGEIISSGVDKSINRWKFGNGNQDIVSIAKIDTGIESIEIGIRSKAIGTDADDRLLLAAGCQDGSIRFWDMESWSEQDAPLKGHDYPVTGIDYSSKVGLLATSSADGTAILWNLDTGEESGRFSDQSDVESSNCVVISPDGMTLAKSSTSGGRGTVQLWNFSLDEGGWIPLTQLSGVPARVTSIAFNPDGKSLVTACHDGSLRLWQVRADEPMHLRGNYGLAFSSDSKTIAVGSNAAVHLWDVEAGVEIGEIPSLNNPVYCVAHSRDPDRWIGGCDDAIIRLWNSDTNKEAAYPKLHSDMITCLAIGPKNEILASGSGSLDGSVRVWNLKELTEVGMAATGHGDRITSVAIHPDATMLVSSSKDGTIRRWKLDARGRPVALGEPIGEVEGAAIWSVAFSPDGGTFASAGADNIVRLWDAASALEMGTFCGHTAKVSSLAFRPGSKGRYLASGSDDRTVRLWDVITRKEVRSLSGHKDGVFSIAFSPDGRLLAASNVDFGTVLVWNVDSVLPPNYADYLDKETKWLELNESAHNFRWNIATDNLYEPRNFDDCVNLAPSTHLGILATDYATEDDKNLALFGLYLYSGNEHSAEVIKARIRDPDAQQRAASAWDNRRTIVER